METLQMEYIDAGKDFLVMKMPVNPIVMQPLGDIARWSYYGTGRNGR